jgi:hypothetical protein
VKIPLGGGAYLEPDEGPRHTRFHKRIVSMKPIPNTRTGNTCGLECGHVVQTFGKLDPAGGVLLCTACRDAAEAG